MNVIYFFRLPMPPSANVYWRNVHGRMIVSQEARDYKEQAGWLANAAGVEIIEGAVSLTADFYVERESRDLDNCLKVLGDSMNGIAWHDDNQVIEIHARRFIAPKPKGGRREGYVDVTIAEAVDG